MLTTPSFYQRLNCLDILTDRYLEQSEEYGRQHLIFVGKKLHNISDMQFAVIAASIVGGLMKFLINQEQDILFK